MENNVNENLRNRLDELKNDSVDKIVESIETKDNYPIPDMSKIPVPDINDLSQPIEGGVDMGTPLMSIDVENGTLNGTKFEAPVEESIEQKPTKLTSEERARLYKEKNSIITVQEEEEKEPIASDQISSVEESLKAVEEDSRRKSEELFRLAQQQQDSIDAEEERKRLKEKGIIDTNDIDDIIDNLNERAAKKELDVEDEEDLTILIQRMEEQKVFSEIVPNKTATGPASYIVEEDDSFKINVEDIVKTNGIKVVKRNGKHKDAILNRFVNSGPHVSMPLVNSGMFITVSGAGTDEIIAMQQLKNDTPVRMEINKLDHVCKHIIDSSVGKLKLSQLLDVVSYYDKDTLFYALFSASNPDESEFQRGCHRCGKPFFNIIRTRDLLLNPEDFEESENDIKDNVTTLMHLIERSKLGKIYKKYHSNGMIIHVKHPSIKSYLETLQSLTQDTMRLYPRLVDLAYSIDKISIHENDNNFIEITDPNEIIEIISKFKDTKAKYEIYDMINDVRPNTLPTYGLKECKCPYCQTDNSVETYDMEDLIFIQAQKKEELEAMKWAARNQQKQKMIKGERKKSKSE